MTSKQREPHLTARSLVTLGLLGGLLFASKLAMLPLPNVKPVALLVMVYAVTLGAKALYPIYTYVGLEILVFGVGLWNLSYLYVWPLLALLSWLFRRMEHPLSWAVLAGFFGLSFGALCALPYLFLEGWQFALAWWIRGLSFDALHCLGNFFITLALFRPCRRLLTRLCRQAGLITKETSEHD